MNNNRNNNRRRGRGNRNQGGGGSQGNRIDSRARGNAPQLLDKYKKLAQDAQHNGDRVQAEYYLQFADHYFRVIADNRARQDEHRGDPRAGRRDERDSEDFDAYDEDTDFGAEDRRRFESREREERGRDRDGRRDRPRREFRTDDAGEEMGASTASEGPEFEPEDNPFTRDPRPSQGAGHGPRPRAGRPRRVAGNGTVNGVVHDEIGIDVAALPPSLSAGDADADGVEAAPRRRRKRGEGGTLSAVG